MKAYVPEDIDPWAFFAARILEKARDDAARGDLAALAWLIYGGSQLADLIAPGEGQAVLSFCRSVFDNIETNKIKATWKGALS